MSKLAVANIIFETTESNRIEYTGNNVVRVRSNGGMQIPFGTTAQRASPEVGLIRYNTDTNTLETYETAGWLTMPTGQFISAVFGTTNVAFNTANAAFASANNVAPQVTPAYTTANLAYALTNTVYASVNSNWTVTNTVYGVANAAFASANNVAPQVTPAFNTANAAFAAANTKLSSSGGTISGDLVVTGNATFSGLTTYANTQTLLIGDNILTLNADLPASVAATENAGLEVNRGLSGNASFIWDETADEWDLRVNNNTIISIVATGNVGIGQTTSPERFGVFRDTDNSAEIGRAHIGFVGYNNFAGFSHVSLNAAGGYALLQSSTGQTFINSTTGSPIYFRNNNADRMILDASGNLGIGTTSPVATLHANTADNNWGEFVSSPSGAIRIGGFITGYSSPTIQGVTSNGAAYQRLFIDAANISFGISGTTKAILDSNGNFGVGVTPGAWSSSTKAFQFGLLGSLIGRTPGSGTYLSDNVYFSGDPSNTAANGVRIGATVATTYMQMAGVHAWYNAGSSTAGSAIAFTQAMTLDVNGNLKIGSEAAEFNVGLTVGTPSYTTAYAADITTNSATAGFGSQLTIVSPNDTSTVAGLSIFCRTTGRSRWDIQNIWQSSYTGDLAFRYRTSTGNNTAEAMRIKSGGNVGIGTASPGYKLDVAGTVNAAALYVNGAPFTSGLANTAATVFLGSANTTTLFNGASSVTRASSLRANRNITGGGDITYDSSANIYWSARFIVISNGYGSNFATVGYFNITCPTSGTITGVGGATNQTATASGIPLTAWTALYYILPIGSAETSVAANFRLVSYASAIDIPHDWVLICIRNGDDNIAYFNNGIRLYPGSTSRQSAMSASLGAGGVILENGQNIGANYTMTTNYNGHSAGPVTINTGVSVTIPTGSNWVIV